MPFPLRTVAPLKLCRLEEGAAAVQRDKDGHARRSGAGLRLFASLEEVCSRSLVSLLWQLSDLSRWAGDIFGGIQSEADSLGRRSVRLQCRLESLKGLAGCLDHRKVKVRKSLAVAAFGGRTRRTAWLEGHSQRLRDGEGGCLCVCVSVCLPAGRPGGGRKKKGDLGRWKCLKFAREQRFPSLSVGPTEDPTPFHSRMKTGPSPLPVQTGARSGPEADGSERVARKSFAVIARGTGSTGWVTLLKCCFASPKQGSLRVQCSKESLGFLPCLAEQLAP